MPNQAPPPQDIDPQCCRLGMRFVVDNAPRHLKMARSSVVSSQHLVDHTLPDSHVSAENETMEVLSCHSKIDKTKVLMENGSLMKVKSIAECSP